MAITQLLNAPASILVKLPHGKVGGVAVMVGVRDLVRVLVRVPVRVTVAVRVGVLVRLGVDVVVFVCVGVGGTQPEPTRVGTYRMPVSQTPLWPLTFLPQQ